MAQHWLLVTVLYFLLEKTTSQLPVISWNLGGESNLLHTIPSGQTIELRKAYDEYLSTFIGKNKHILIFLQDELSVDDLTKYKSSFKYLQRLSQERKPLVLPSVNTKGVSIDKFLLKKFPGKVQHVYNEGIKDWAFNKENMVVVFHLEPVSGTIGEAKTKIIKSNDELFHNAVKEVEKSIDQFSVIYTALLPSQVISQILSNEEFSNVESVSRRHLLEAESTAEKVSVVGNGKLFNDSGCVLFYTTGIKFGKKDNLSEFLNATWMPRSIACNKKEYRFSIATTDKRGNTSSLEILFDLVANEAARDWYCKSLVVTWKYDGKNYTEEPSCGGQVYKKEKAWPFAGPVEIITPFSYSYACNEVKFPLRKDGFVLEIIGLQLEPNLASGSSFTKFSDAYNCVGFFSIEILSGLFVTFILAGGLFVGIMMMMAIQTPERFDDPKGPSITVPTQE